MKDVLKSLYKIKDSLSERSKSLLRRNTRRRLLRKLFADQRSSRVRTNNYPQHNFTDPEYVTDVEMLIKWEPDPIKKSNTTFVKRKDISELIVARSNDSNGNIIFKLIKTIICEVLDCTSRLIVPIKFQNRGFTMEMDTGTRGNLISFLVWKQLGKLKLDDVKDRYESASKNDLPVQEMFMD